MTTVAVLANPPVAGAVLRPLVEGSVVTDSEAVRLYRAMVADVCEAVHVSGAELLVNYRSAGDVPVDVSDPEDELRTVVEGALDETEDVRYEVQVGSSFAARVGNTVTHLLEREAVQTAAAVTPGAVFLGRQHVDGAAMKLRRSEVVLGPATRGRVYYAGFSEPVEFTGAYDAPAVESLVDAASDAGLATDFVPMLPTLEAPADLRTVLPLLDARADAGVRIPSRTASVLADITPDVEENATDGS